MQTSHFRLSRTTPALLLALCASSAIAQPAGSSALGQSSHPQPEIEDVRTTQGSVTLTGGRDVAFTAQAGIIAVGDTDADDASAGGPDASGGHAVARMSYVAYVAQQHGPQPRPVLFLWDGGPGASSRALVVDSFGPVRVTVPRPGDPTPIQPATTANPDCLLDVADLVFIDAPGTGFGRIEGRDAASRFYGLDGDAGAFKRFIERFLARHDRSGSPIYLFGHSYGTMRNAVVARLLAEDDMPPRGIISVSQWLNHDDNIDAAPANPGTDNAYIDALPSYAATAWYHHRLQDRAPSLAPFLARAEAFALHDYATALLAGASLPPAQEQTVASSLESFTGVSRTVWLKAHLRIDAFDFRRLVLDQPDRAVGRLDTRYVGLVADPLASRAEGDPFGDAVGPTVAAAADHYERDVLGVGGQAVFAPYADVPDLRWDEYHSTDGKPWDTFFNVGPDLAQVMIQYPTTRLLMMGGYYDLGTTYLGAVEELRHLPIPHALQANIGAAFYEAGHEMYYQDDARHDMHDRIARFIRP